MDDGDNGTEQPDTSEKVKRELTQTFIEKCKDDNELKEYYIPTWNTAKKFLATHLWSINKAGECYKNYLRLMVSKNYFAVTPTSPVFTHELFSEKMTVITEKRDPNGSIIVWFQFSKFMNKPTAWEALHTFLFQIEAAFEREDAQRKGMTMLFDFNGFRWCTYDQELFFALFSILMDGFPCRVSRVILYGMPFGYGVSRIAQTWHHYLPSTQTLIVKNGSSQLAQLLGDACPIGLVENANYFHSHKMWLKAICFPAVSNVQFYEEFSSHWQLPDSYFDYNPMVGEIWRPRPVPVSTAMSTSGSREDLRNTDESAQAKVTTSRLRQSLTKLSVDRENRGKEAASRKTEKKAKDKKSVKLSEKKLGQRDAQGTVTSFLKAINGMPVPAPSWSRLQPAHSMPTGTIRAASSVTSCPPCTSETPSTRDMAVNVNVNVKSPQRERDVQKSVVKIVQPSTPSKWTDKSKLRQPDSEEVSVALPSLDFPADEMVSWHQPHEAGLEDEELHQSAQKETLMQHEFAMLRGDAIQTATFDLFAKEENRCKNRYVDVKCYDHSIVSLTPIDCDITQSYIHASYADGYNSKNAYICTQGPTSSTLGDFWRMVYEQQAFIIVMVTNLLEKGKIKCECYWPIDDGLEEHYGDFTVMNCGVVEKKSYAITSLFMRNERTHRCQIVFHFWMKTWFDMNTPEVGQLFHFVREVRLARREFLPTIWPTWTAEHPTSPLGPPVIVHCSAGIGRTGTYCTIEINMDRYDEEQKVEVFNTVRKLRRQRHGSVQMYKQYSFIYEALDYYVQHMKVDANALNANCESVTVLESVKSVHIQSSAQLAHTMDELNEKIIRRHALVDDEVDRRALHRLRENFETYAARIEAEKRMAKSKLEVKSKQTKTAASPVEKEKSNTSSFFSSKAAAEKKRRASKKE